MQPILASDARRIAILHFSVEPCIGGIERLIGSQVSALSDLGYVVRLITGHGAKPRGGDLIRLPDLDPAHAAVRRATAELGKTWPAPDDALVERLVTEIGRALADCDQCWVHNAFTMLLHPFLTVALRRLVEELPSISWVAWCEDISASSRFWEAPAGRDRAWLTRPLDGVRYVTISSARQRELATLFDLSPSQIAVIPPPLEYDDWLSVGAGARIIVQRLDLLRAEPIVFVPAKLLPHKNLELAVRAAAHLKSIAPQPAVLLSGAGSPHERMRSRALKQSLVALARELGAEHAVHFLPDVLGQPVSRRTLRDLMLLCDVVLLPSTEEGFGVPVLEAASLRAPVACADIPAFRESGGQAAHYFELTSHPAAVARLLREISELPANRARRQAVTSNFRFRDAIAGLAGS